MASRFWVGGTGTWDTSSTTHWASTSGGSAGASVPTTADTVTFDSNSGTGIVTTSTGTVSASITINSANIELKLGANHSVTGSCTLTLGTLNLNNFILFLSGNFNSNNSNVRTLAFGTSGKISIANSGSTIWNCPTITNLIVTGEPVIDLTYTGSTGTRAIQHAFTAGGTSANAVSFNVLSGSDTVSLGKQVKNLNCTGFNGNLASSSIRVYKNLTLSPTQTTSLVSGATVFVFYPSFGEGTYTTNGVTINGATILGIGESSGYGKFVGNVTQTGSMTISGTATYRFTAGSTYTFSTLLFTTTSTSRTTLLSTVPGTRYTFSSSSGTVTAQYMTIQDCAATGGATWNAARSLGNSNAGNNTGWNFSGTLPITTPLSMRLGFGL